MAPKKLVIRSVQNTDYWSAERGISRPADDYDLYVVRIHGVWRPPTDVYEIDQHVVVKVEIAGIDEEDLSISLVDRRLIVAGHRRDPADKLSYQNMEIRYGEFHTEVRIGWALDASAIEATYENGFLLVRLPRPKQHRVRVQTC